MVCTILFIHLVCTKNTAYYIAYKNTNFFISPLPISRTYVALPLLLLPSFSVYTPFIITSVDSTLLLYRFLLSWRTGMLVEREVQK